MQEWKEKAIELLMPGIFIIISILVILNSFSMSGTEGVFPRMVAILLLITSALVGASTIRNKEHYVSFEGLYPIKALIAFIALILYAAILKHIGYIIATILLGVFIMWFLGYRKPVRAVFYTCLAVACTFFIFKVLLNVPLPLIFLDF